MMGIDFIPFRKQVDKKGKFSDLPQPAAAPAAAAAAAAGVAAQLAATHLDGTQ